jgi:hypothetical protein
MAEHFDPIAGVSYEIVGSPDALSGRRAAYTFLPSFNALGAVHRNLEMLRCTIICVSGGWT